MFDYNTVAGDPRHAPNPGRMAGQMQRRAQPGRVGAVKRYDIVGADGEPGLWDKIKDWGDRKTWGVANKWLALGGTIVAGVWIYYGVKHGWFK